MGRKPSFLDSSLKIDGIIEIMELVRKEPLYFHEMVKKSKIKFKKSFMKYLRYCFEKGFVRKRKKFIILELTGYGKTYDQGHHAVFYSTTQKGKKFLELVK